MKLLLSAFLALFLVVRATAHPGARVQARQEPPEPHGTGPYAAVSFSCPLIRYLSNSQVEFWSWTTDLTLSNHTIFAPVDIASDLNLPVIVWGQTGCSYNGLRFEDFLIEVASHGILILANGIPGGEDNPNGIGETSSPDSSLHLQALDWITEGEGVKAYASADTSRIAAAGQSCGGIQAYSVAGDERVTAIGIFNSGMIDASSPIPSMVTKPIFYFLGGPTDIAYENGERDYINLPANTPKWKGNLPLGHMADYLEENGGKFGVAASNWAKWILRGDETAAAFFLEGGAEGDGWNVVHEDLDGLDIVSLD